MSGAEESGAADMEGMTNEKRWHSRTPCDVGCKLFHQPSRSYVSARTRDTSDGGALVSILGARPMRVGERVQFGIGDADRAVLSTNELRDARVVRVCVDGSGKQTVAVMFDQARAIAA